MQSDKSLEVKTGIINSARLLRDKADEISLDIYKERVKNIYITISITPNDAPSLDISKTYYIG